MTIDDDDTAEDRAFDEYVAAASRGEVPDVDDFCRRHNDTSGRLRRRIEGLRWMLRDDGAPEDGGADDDALPFERLGEFKLVRKLGAGGMGLVFLATQESLGRHVALKILRPERVGSRTAERRFEREVLAVARLQHPNIVTVHATGESSGVRWLAMEYVPGEGLDDRLERARRGGEPIGIKDALRWGRQLADALHAAHESGVVHRDVKPSNVRLTEDGDAKLLDFGVAREIDAGASSLTEGFTGSPHYAAPEQIDATHGDISPATDVFALGVTLYEALVGVVPFESSSTGALFHRILTEEPPPPRSRAKALPRDVETVVLKALRKDPARRYVTAREMGEDLAALLEYRPISARPAGPIERAWGWLRRHRAVAAATAVVGAAAIVVGVTHALETADLGRRHRAALDEASAAADRGDFDAALAATARAEALDVDPDAARQVEGAITARRRAVRVRGALDDARAALDRYGAARDAVRDLEVDLVPLRTAWSARFVTEDEERRRFEGERELESLARSSEEEFFRCVEAARVASTLEEGNRDADALLAALYAARYREAVAQGDRSEATLWSEHVRRHDEAGRYAALLDPQGRVVCTVTPAKARVWLFRMQPQDEVRPGGAPRLVPVPYGVDAPAVLPGDPVLAVVDGNGALSPTDLVVLIDGYPAASTIWITASDDPRLQPGDVLRSVDGTPVGDIRTAQATRLIARRNEGATTRVVVERSGAPLEVDVAAWGTRAVELADGAERLRLLPCVAVVARGGRRVTEKIDAGVLAHATAAPLVPSDAALLPDGGRDGFPAGSWIALISADGHEPLRVPFLVEANQTTRLEARLVPTGTTPRGFIRIPAGPLPCGGDPEAQNAWPDLVRHVDEFLIARYPVTAAEYQEFLNDAAILPRIASSPEPIGYPRSPQNFATGGFWSRDEDGEYLVPAPERRWPIYGITRRDARQFTLWKSVRAAAAGERFRYTLPTEEQWERAARGVDRRKFAHGDVFVPRWIDSMWDAETPDIDPVGACPIDESPFGLHDVTGGVFEWCDDTLENGLVPLRSCGWSNAFPPFYRLATRVEATDDWSNASTGMRLVAVAVE